VVAAHAPAPPRSSSSSSSSPYPRRRQQDEGHRCVPSTGAGQQLTQLGAGAAGGGWVQGASTRLSHPLFRRKPSAYLYACQDQVSCI
jgi:hypothetical protein